MSNRAREVELQLFEALEPARLRSQQVIEREVARWKGPKKLIEAMRYAVLGDGKRARPAMALDIAALLGGEAAVRRVESAACALEWLHAYSLVHDDLPAMDNDDFRRGRPTVHRAFDEATAILVGDALQSEAFRLVAGADDSGRDERVRMLQTFSLAKHVGLEGMCGGQAVDIGHEAKTPEEIRAMHGAKTGALFVAACEIAAYAAGASEEQVAAWARYGLLFGLAYQLSDDVLDLDEVESSEHEADVNLAHLIGAENAVAMVRQDCEEGLALLDAFQVPDGHTLRLLLHWNEARAAGVLEDAAAQGAAK